MRLLRRLRRFASTVALFATQSPRLLTPHNVRALWKQSDPRWLDGLVADVTDEEWERFREAIGDA